MLQHYNKYFQKNIYDIIVSFLKNPKQNLHGELFWINATLSIEKRILPSHVNWLCNFHNSYVFASDLEKQIIPFKTFILILTDLFE